MSLSEGGGTFGLLLKEKNERERGRESDSVRENTLEHKKSMDGAVVVQQRVGVGSSGFCSK
jgi:hypothetical protein